MTIYAASITAKGKRFLASEKADNAPLRKMILLAVIHDKSWVDMKNIISRLEVQCKTLDVTINGLPSDYAHDALQITNDLLSLARLEYIELARYRYSDGQYASNPPVGMVFT